MSDLSAGPKKEGSGPSTGSEELRTLEEGLPRLQEEDLKKAARSYKAATC